MGRLTEVQKRLISRLFDSAMDLAGYIADRKEFHKRNGKREGLKPAEVVEFAVKNGDPLWDIIKDELNKLHNLQNRCISEGISIGETRAILDFFKVGEVLSKWRAEKYKKGGGGDDP